MSVPRPPLWRRALRLLRARPWVGYVIIACAWVGMAGTVAGFALGSAVAVCLYPTTPPPPSADGAEADEGGDNSPFPASKDAPVITCPSCCKQTSSDLARCEYCRAEWERRVRSGTAAPARRGVRPFVLCVVGALFGCLVAVTLGGMVFGVLLAMAGVTVATGMVDGLSGLAGIIVGGWAGWRTGSRR